MAGEKFFFIFSEQPSKRVFIDEPIDYSIVDFNLDRQDDGMALDVSLNGGENRFRIVDFRDHQLPEMLYYSDRYGFEANVKFGIIFSNGQEILNQVDFEGSSTNDFDYFEFSTMVVSTQQLFKRRIETKIDMFSDTSIDGELIGALQPVNMLLKAKPSVQTTQYKQFTPYSGIAIISPVVNYFNITQGFGDKSEIKNSFTPFMQRSQQRSDMQILEAGSNLKNVVISFKNIDINILGTASKDVSIRLIKTVSDVNNSTPDSVPIYSNITSSVIILPSTLPDYELGDMQRGEKLYLYLFVNSAGAAQVNINSIDIEIRSLSTSYNTIVPSFRLFDVMQQIAKSTAGLNIFAPRYNIGGEFYDTVLTNGKLLGGNTNDPFYVSFKDILDSIKGEHHAGYGINVNGEVFVGTEDDFYTNVECGAFEDIQFDTLEKTTNPKLALNTFKLNFANYQSLKENTEPNSGSTIHGETILTFANKEVENSVEMKIPWIRDAILLDVQQRLSTIVSKDTATQDDDKIFAIDTINTESDFTFTESTTLQHTYDGLNLSLRSNGEVNFNVLGIKTNTEFIIEYPDLNAGIYQVVFVANTELKLLRTSGGAISTANDGIRLTKYTYEIKQDTIPLTNRTNESFNLVLNLISPDKYSNLRYSVERIVRKRWAKFLAAVNLFRKDQKITNTYYKNNGSCITDYDGLYIQEKENFLPGVEPIMTPNRYEGITFANVDFEDFILLQNKLRTYHGYITMKDVNRRILQIYPDKLMYQNDSRAIVVDGNEKYIRSYMTMTNQDNIIVINDETSPTVLKWDLIDHKLEVFDLERQRLYNGVYWYKVSINGSIATSLSEFIDRMNLIGEKFDSTAF